MPTTPEDFLDTAEGAGKVMAHARLLLKLTRRLRNALPEPLDSAAQVANFKSGRIVIHAENGAVAAKIRQMSQRLCSELSVEGAKCNGIDVKVQPQVIPWQSSASNRKPLSATTISLLTQTASDLPQGALRSALEALLTRADRRPGE